MGKKDDHAFSAEVHIDMWKHYDNLRQAKNSAFLTANSILAAVVGLLHNQPDRVILVFVACLGIPVCCSWFLLLARNAAYIDYQRERAGGGDKAFWTPVSWTPASKYLDGTLAVAFAVFWVGIIASVCYAINVG